MVYPIYHEQSNWVDVAQMYEYAKSNNLELLSMFNADFWNDYITNSDRYDLLFKRKYKHFRYFDQDAYSKDNTVEKVTREFIEEVYNHLLINKKRYEELYRVHILSDTDYNIFDNVNYTETRNDNENGNGTNTYGERIDNTDMSTGSRTDTSEDMVSAYNSSNYENSSKTTDIKGEQNDNTSYTKGEQIDTNIHNKTTESTTTKKGKVSGASAESLIQEHIDLWSLYEFYDYIFMDIASELLLV